MLDAAAHVAQQRLAAQGRRRDGSHFPVEVTLRDMTINREHMTSAVVRDTTEQSRHEEAIQKHIRQLEALSDSLRERSQELANERDRAEAATQAKSLTERRLRCAEIA